MRVIRLLMLFTLCLLALPAGVHAEPGGAGQSNKFVSTSSFAEGASGIEAAAREAVRTLTPAKAAEFQVSVHVRVIDTLGGLPPTDLGKRIDESITSKPLRLGDYGNNVKKFMRAVRKRAAKVTKIDRVWTYQISGGVVQRPPSKTVSQKLKTRFRAAMRQRRMKRSAARARTSAPAAPKTKAKPIVRAKARGH